MFLELVVNSDLVHQNRFHRFAKIHFFFYKKK